MNQARTMELWEGTRLNADEVVTQKLAFVGRSGNGKSYLAAVLVEQLRAAGHQVVVLDWVGNWYGLRLDKSGKKDSGLQIYIFGGEHGDVPIEPTSGAMVADILAETRASAVVDISEWSQAKRTRFATDFAERLLWAKRRHRSPMMVVIEEAQTYAPQKMNSKGDAPMLGAFQELAKVGRNRGIGLTLITQRPQAMSKEVLNQTELLVTFQMPAPHERKAIKDWIDEKGAGGAMLDELPKLKPGHAIAWSPVWLGFLDRVKIHRRQSYDATKTPEIGDRSDGRAPS